MTKHLRKTTIQTIRHKDQVYETFGDYRIQKGILNLFISRFENPDYEFLIAVHEFIESYLILKKGIKIKDIDKFDKENIDHEDPGCLKSSPYHTEHILSMKIEKILAKHMEIDWDKYYNSQPK